MSDSKVREAFEQHALSRYGGNDDAWLEWCPAGPCVRTPIHGGGIDDRFVGNDWAAWQASRAAALEEAAAVCEANVLLSGSHGPLMNVGWALAIKASAKAIRALAGRGA